MQRRRHLVRGTQASPTRSRASQLLDENTDYAVDEDDDEETLQLKLAAIEARLKLKKLQQQNGVKAKVTNNGAEGHFRPRSQDSNAGAQLLGERRRNGEDTEVQVPLSPFRKPALPKDPTSPRRVLLGIDKGLKAHDVSLKRPPGSRDSARPSSAFSSGRPGTATRERPSSALISQSFPSYDSPKIKSFSERLRESKAADKAKWDKAQNIARNRSTGFAVDKKDLENFKAAAAADRAPKQLNNPSASEKLQNQHFSRADIVQAYKRPRSPLRRTKTASSASDRPSSRDTVTLERSNSQGGQHGYSSQPDVNHTRDDHENRDSKPADPSKFEPFSGLHLSNRILPHSYVSRKTDSMKKLRIPDLLKAIKGPPFELPDTDGDYVVFGIVGSKSTPRTHQEKRPDLKKDKDPYDGNLNNSSKYMVLTLTDLKWSIDLFLFATAFPKYYKMSPGTLIAILNPSIMPPPPNKTHTNAFSLTVSSSEDTILEIGSAQDISFCKSVRKDGKVCDAWVDGRKTDYCDFHVDLQLQKTTAGRMEVNSGPGFGRGPRSGRFGNRGGRGRGGQENGLKSEGGVYDRASGSTYYVAPPVPGGTGSFQPSAAGLLDADNPFAGNGEFFHRRGDAQGERLRKRLADQERERNIAKRLGEFKSVGSEYLRAQYSESGSDKAATAACHQRKPDGDVAKSARAMLGLDKSARNANNVKLGRIKKRDFETSTGATPIANGRSSPIKKTRFITSKGIREAGRDSLGTNPGTYSDDDLEIVG